MGVRRSSKRADRQALRAEVAAIDWYHSIPLGHGVVTPGASQTPTLRGEELPPLRGRSVLDVGAFDGYYSFLAEREGARRVVALDHYIWGVDMAARTRYWDDCKARGELPDRHKEERDFYDPSLPRRRGFELAHRVLDSRVEPVVGDFMTMDLGPLGTFDVVLFLGLLYHLTEPMTALERLRAVTSQVAVIETEAIVVPGREGDKLMLFYEADEKGGDYTNWFSVTEPALHGLCRAAGFRRVETRIGPPGRSPGGPEEALPDYRIVVHAFA